MTFPEGFLWGAATASYQIEGAVREDGRGECIWSRFSHTSGKVLNGDTGDVACDHYHLYRSDVALMARIGLRAYRFSIAWPRVLPFGTGAPNEVGLDFYDRLVDELLAVNIRPFVTLYHWDLPQALQDRGGWDNPEVVQWFGEYTDRVSRRLGDRVKDWITLNEPWVVAFLGNWLGIHAPGLCDLGTAYRVLHHQLLAHGAAIAILRRNVQDVSAGITIDLGYFEPATERSEDVQAAWREDGFKNRWLLDAVFKGHYPTDVINWVAEWLDGIDLDAVAQAAAPLDFLGINYYTRTLVEAASSGVTAARPVKPANAAFTTMGWEVYPEGLYQLLVRVHREYQPRALFVTENGAAFADVLTPDGKVHDEARRDYLRQHFDAAERAIQVGVPLRGYFVWSLMDNFEWSLGYTQRFGIVYVDYATQQRIVKDSGQWYAEVIRQNQILA